MWLLTPCLIPMNLLPTTEHKIIHNKVAHPCSSSRWNPPATRTCMTGWTPPATPPGDGMTSGHQVLLSATTQRATTLQVAGCASPALATSRAPPPDHTVSARCRPASRVAVQPPAPPARPPLAPLPSRSSRPSRSLPDLPRSPSGPSRRPSLRCRLLHDGRTRGCQGLGQSKRTSDWVRGG
jgi:hypothetical protein